MSKFLEQIDRSDPTRSQYKIGLLDSTGEVLKTVDVSGVEAAWNIFDQVSKVIAGELDFEIESHPVESEEGKPIDAEIVKDRANEYDEKPMAKQVFDKMGRKAKNVSTRYEKDVLDKAISNLEDQINKYQSQ